MLLQPADYVLTLPMSLHWSRGIREKAVEFCTLSCYAMTPISIQNHSVEFGRHATALAVVLGKWKGMELVIDIGDDYRIPGAGNPM